MGLGSSNASYYNLIDQHQNKVKNGNYNDNKNLHTEFNKIENIISQNLFQPVYYPETSLIQYIEYYINVMAVSKIISSYAYQEVYTPVNVYKLAVAETKISYDSNVLSIFDAKFIPNEIDLGKQLRTYLKEEESNILCVYTERNKEFRRFEDNYCVSLLYTIAPRYKDESMTHRSSPQYKKFQIIAKFNLIKKDNLISWAPFMNTGNFHVKIEDCKDTLIEKDGLWIKYDHKVVQVLKTLI